MMEEEAGSPELFLFLASTVHDMKNSISVLSGTLEALLAPVRTDAAAPAAPTPAKPSPAGPIQTGPDHAYARMAHMLYQTKRLNDNLMQLLALYKQVGKPAYPFDLRPQLVGQLVEQVAAQQRTLLLSNGIAFHTDCPPELIWHVDEDLVIGVLIHAINNAVRYTADAIRLSLVEVDGMLEIRVEDNGAGFPAALIAAGAAAAQSRTQGVNFATNSTGLGLYFAAEVARMHKHRGRSGAIALENGGALGGGCFVLRLP